MSDELVKQWGEYVESMGSVMGDVEHIAQQMCDRIESLQAERDKWKTAFDESCNAWQQQCEYEMDRAKKAEAERDRAEDELYELQQTCITLRGENETLTAEREASEQDNYRWKMECENFWRERIETLTAERDRLREAIDYILDGMGIADPDYDIDPDDDFLDAANSEWVRDTLTRLAAALKGESHERPDH